MPYVVASQTIPIVALAPLIIYLVGHNVSSVVIIATYLSFYPVTIAMLRGLRSPDPRALELMRSYAAGRWAVLWKVRFPASLPYLFTALKITATASIVGAIVGEGPGGIQAGLGRAILFFAQQYTVAPEKLWGAILFTALLGIIFFGSCAGRRCGFCATARRQRPDDRDSRRSARRSSCRHRQVVRNRPARPPRRCSDINLEIARGEFVSLIGPSGCGKSTLLRVIGDLTEPSGGAVGGQRQAGRSRPPGSGLRHGLPVADAVRLAQGGGQRTPAAGAVRL